MKKVLVLGADGGIGTGVSKILNKKGKRIYICGRNREKLYKLKEELLFEKSYVEIFDILNMEEMDKATKEMGQLDAIVNCAGILKDDLIANIKINVWEKILKTNFFSSVSIYDKCCNKLDKNAVIVNIASISGIRVKPGQCAYAVSKSMMIKWTEMMAQKNNGKYFFAISPGPVETEMIKKTKWYTEEKKISRIPLHRFAQPEEIGFFVNMLIEKPDYFSNGFNFIIDGGFLETYRN